MLSNCASEKVGEVNSRDSRIDVSVRSAKLRTVPVNVVSEMRIDVIMLNCNLADVKSELARVAL